MRKLILLLFLFAACSFAQTSITHGSGAPSASNCNATRQYGREYMDITPTPPDLYMCGSAGWQKLSSGGASPAGSAGACQIYATSSTFGGDASICLAQLTAVSAPAIPTVTTHGMAGAETYTYQTVFVAAVGYSAPSPSRTIMTGNITLDMTNYNIIASPTCPSGITQYVVYKLDDPNGLTGQMPGVGTCGSPYNDQGQFPSFEPIPSYDMSVGIYNGGRTYQKSFGDQVWWSYSGTPLQSFPGGSHTIPNYASLTNSIWAFAYHGNLTQLYTGMDVLVEQDASDVTGNYVEASTTEGFTQKLGGTAGASVAIAGASGANNISDADAYKGRVVTLAAGGITGFANTFHVLGGTILATGAIANEAGVNCEDMMAATTLTACIYSQVSAGSGRWAFYGAGTGASHFGGEVEVVGLKTTGAATGKTVVCVDTATGKLYASSSGVACAN